MGGAGRRAAGAYPHGSQVYGRVCTQRLEHAPSDHGPAQMQAVITQQQLVVAHELVRDASQVEPGAKQARASLEVRDRDKPPVSEFRSPGI